MNLIDLLKKKTIKVVEAPKWGVYLRQQWEDSFINHLSLQEKEAIYLYNDDGACGYLWHVFSFEKRDCLKGEEAIKAFNKVKKSNCYIFFQHSEDVYIVEDAGLLDAYDLLKEQDVYVVDKEFNWTYVRTHEDGWCGPYFSIRGKKQE